MKLSRIFINIIPGVRLFAVGAFLELSSSSSDGGSGGGSGGGGSSGDSSTFVQYELY